MNDEDKRIGISLAGAVDLSAMKAESEQKGPAQGAKRDFSYVLDVSFASVESYAPASAAYPILLLIYGEGSRGFAEEEAKEVEKQKGKLQLLKIDAARDPEGASALDLSTLPVIFAMIKGQLLPLFEGPLGPDSFTYADLAEGSVRAALEAAAEEGVTGTAPMMGKKEEEEKEPEGKSIFSEAEKLAREGNFDEAARKYKEIANQNPGNRDASSKAAQAELIARVKGSDPSSVRDKAAEDPKDIQSQLAAADLDIYGGHIEDGFCRLLDYIAKYGDPQGKAKDRILSYILMLPAGDPRAKSARMKLANLLY